MLKKTHYYTVFQKNVSLFIFLSMRRQQFLVRFGMQRPEETCLNVYNFVHLAVKL